MNAPTKHPSHLKPIAYRVGDAAAALGIGRSKLYEAMKAGELTARKIGASTVIDAGELHRWFSSMPEYRPQHAA